MTPEEFMQVDEDIPTCEEMGESWDEDLLMSRVAETEDDLTEEPSIIGEATPCVIMSHQEALRMFDEFDVSYFLVKESQLAETRLEV
mgnify:CR=1 FL=1